MIAETSGLRGIVPSLRISFLRGVRLARSTGRACRVADDAVGIAAGVRAGAVADGLARVQQIEPAQRVQHDERRQQTAHADLVLQRRLIHLGRIEALYRTPGDRTE